MNSVNYYNENAAAFIERTFNLDVSHLMEAFLSQIPPGGRILDLGCGSGRDAKHFMEMGYEVYAIDASERMVEHAKRYLGDRVSLATFESYETDMLFDGIWAQASLIHVAEDDLVSVIRKYRDMLKSGGVFHMSFKAREENFTQGHRSFNCFDERRLRKKIGQVYELIEIRVYTSASIVKEHAGEHWVNGLFKRNKIEYWDVLDSDRQKTGKVSLRGNDLATGEYHLVVFGIIQNSDGRFILSKRSPEKIAPNTWEVTGGAAVQGDSSHEAIVREIYEELGIEVTSKGRLLRSDRFEEACSYFADIWYFEEDIDIDSIVCQKEEVSEARVMTLQEVIELNDAGVFMPGHQHMIKCLMKLEQ